jgi:hypothetical protein
MIVIYGTRIYGTLLCIVKKKGGWLQLLLPCDRQTILSWQAYAEYFPIFTN